MNNKYINKASVIKDPNKYIWVRKQTSGIITDKNVVLEIVNADRGIAYYYKDTKANILLWRFTKNKGWTEETARIFALAFSNGETNKHIYKANKMKEKMKLLVELSNQKFHEFIEQAQEERPDIVKSKELLDKVNDKGFKFFGIVKAYQIVEKDEKGKTVTKNRLRTTFTSNKGDLHWDVTSKAAIEKAVSDLSGKVIPIRFEHGTEDYGVWDTFKTEERDGILYGIAEGEIYQEYNRSKDLWHDIYELGKEFATSYGGRWIEFHWYAKEDTGEVLRVFDEVVIEEISLTTRPANPDTAVESLVKYAGQLENTLDTKVLNDIISKNKSMNKDEVKKGAETDEVVTTPVEQPAEGAQPVPEAKPEETPAAPAAEVKPDEKQPESGEGVTPTTQPEEPAQPAEKSAEKDTQDIAKTLENINKSLGQVENIAKAFGDVAKELDSISKRLAAVENQPEKPAAVAKTDANSDEETTKAVEEVKKNFPFSSLMMKKYGIIS